jgi:3-polyprenyl-4-hydroxybenzoate decarboxylase
MKFSLVRNISKAMSSITNGASNGAANGAASNIVKERKRLIVLCDGTEHHTLPNT